MDYGSHKLRTMCGRLLRGFPEQKYEIFLSEGKLRYSSQFLSVLPLFAGSGRGLAGVAARTFESIRSVAEYGLELVYKRNIPIY